MHCHRISAFYMLAHEMAALAQPGAVTGEKDAVDAADNPIMQGANYSNG